MKLVNINFLMTEDFNSKIVERMITARKEQGITQVQMAQRLGITQSNYGHYERGFRKIPTQRLPDVAQALGINLEVLMGIEQHSSKKRGPQSELEKRFNSVSKLPKSKQKEIIKVVDALLLQAS